MSGDFRLPLGCGGSLRSASRMTRAYMRREEFRPLGPVVVAALSGLVGIVLLSYVFGAGILATTINLVAGIVTG